MGKASTKFSYSNHNFKTHKFKIQLYSQIIILKLYQTLPKFLLLNSQVLFLLVVPAAAEGLELYASDVYQNVLNVF
ncbi:unnamed protein product [Camellia sinensis]